MKREAERKRLAAVLAFKKHGTLSAAARETGTDLKFVKRWVGRINSGHGVAKRSGGGRPRTLDKAGAGRALELLLAGNSGADRIASKLFIEGITKNKLHRTTVARRAKEEAKSQGRPIVALTGKPKQGLTQATKAKRLQFALDNKSRDWRSVMFSDRKRFQWRYPGTSIRPVSWVEKGQRREAVQASHPLSLNVYMGITVHGLTRCHVVAGSSKHKSTFTNKKGGQAKNITGAEYVDVLETTLLPDGCKLFKEHGVSCWTFQQDNDPSHKKAASIVENWKGNKNHSVELLQGWPPHSPDLSPIENVWGMVQNKVDAKGCKTFDEFTAAVVQELQAVSKEALANLYNSMKNRMAKVIQNKGGKTRY